MFVNLWKRAPFLRLIIPFISGMIITLYFDIPFIAPILAALLLIAFIPLPLKWRFALQNFRGACLVLSICCFGMLLMQHADIRGDASWYGHQLKDSTHLVVQLIETPLKKTNSWKAEAEVLAVEDRKTKGRMFLYFREQPALQYGDRLMIKADVQRIRSMGNPGEFDYGRYCSYKNIFHQAFLRRSQYALLPGEKRTSWLITSREYCLQTLRTYVPQREAYGIAQALLIGYREELDKDIVQAYTNTGVVHIIAISGLHLGLIYVTLLQLLQWLPKNRWMEIPKAMLLIVVLWAFSLLTGASASVLRSAVMFTTIAVGQYMISRHTNIYNTLSSAAFLLLCYNPYFLVDAGFQLSFLAVGGILLCYKPIYDCWMIKNKWIDKLWQMIAVSLAAQVFTWPVCLFYFHQFPNLFLLANIIAVPLSTILLYGEILLMIFSAVPLIAGWLGKLTGWGIMLMNSLIQWIDQIPGAVTNNIPINMLQTVMLYMLVSALCCWLLAKWKSACYWMLGMMVVYAGYGVFINITTIQQRKLIIYNIPKHNAIAYLKGKGCLLYVDSMYDATLQRYVHPSNNYFRIKRFSMLQEKESIAPLSTTPMQAENKLQKATSQYAALMQTDHIPLFKATLQQGEFIQLNHQRILLLKKLPRDAPAQRLQIDYILLSHNSKVDISRLQDFFIYDRLIFDATCPAFLIRKWKSAGNKLPLRCFSVPDEGAFVINL